MQQGAGPKALIRSQARRTELMQGQRLPQARLLPRKLAVHLKDRFRSEQSVPRQHGDRHRAHARVQRNVACTAVAKVECDPAAGDDRDAASDHVFGDQVPVL